MTMCECDTVKEVAYTDEPTRNYHPNSAARLGKFLTVYQAGPQLHLVHSYCSHSVV